ncbi:MAG: hypothetical protein WCH58_00515 [Candidatus Saccharibacteria bacterium]
MQENIPTSQELKIQNPESMAIIPYELPVSELPEIIPTDPFEKARYVTMQLNLARKAFIEVQ